MNGALSREVEIDARHAALLIVDVQNYTARRDGGEYRDLTEREIEERFGFFFRMLEEAALPNLQRCRPPAARAASRSCTRSSKA
jgi:ureidoacrylate peracid hydrolase